MEIRGKTVLVTGAAAGIGRAAAVQFARKGAARVVVADVDDAGAAETVRLVGAAGRYARVDLADMDALQQWLAEEATSGYDILYNNAGVVSGALQFPHAGVAKNRRIIDINLTAVVVATERALQAMAARGGGVIITTVSTVALGEGFSDVLYATTKAGVQMLVKSCAPFQQSMNVRVLGVLPGLTDTPILLKTGADGKHAPWMAPILANNAMCSPDDIADAVIDLVEQEDVPGGAWVAVRKIDGAIVREWSPLAAR